MSNLPPDSPLRLLEGIEPHKLTTEQLVAEIKRLATTSLKGASPGYYVDRLEAIAELADVVGRRLGDT